MKKPWKTYLLWILLTEAAGGLSGWLTREGTKAYSQAIVQPPLSPPGWVFPVVWTILFALMGIGAARIYLAPPSKARSRGLNLFISQLVVNFFWSPIFFNPQAFGLAFFWLLLLWGLVIWMILTFRKVDRTAANLQIPYLLWLTFAAYLNAGVWYLNM
ncbi:MAG: tryptophan-rich sensory protein [Oscillospiraceae bacterium]|nr:tryptophan-rich sensory protein [Oscillospiraceae bacterium]